MGGRERRPPSDRRGADRAGRDAATHQFGEPGRTIRARKKKALRFQVGGKWVTKKQVRITIPARPFLGLSEDDMQEMKATVEEFIQKED